MMQGKFSWRILKNFSNEAKILYCGKVYDMKIFNLYFCVDIHWKPNDTQINNKANSW